MIVSLPFYFLGLFSLKDIDGNRIMGTLKFLSIGITKTYGKYAIYFNTRGPNFINAITGLFIASLVIFLLYVLILTLGKNSIEQKKYISISFATSLFTHGLYAAGIVILILFYTNIHHASYVVLGSARLGFGAIIGLLSQLIATTMYCLNWFDFVVIPFVEKRKSKKEICVDEHETQESYQKTPTSSIQKLKFYLVINKGEYTGGKIELNNDEEIVIGKDARCCTVVINGKYKTISRKHCGVIRKGYKFYIKDYSSNGTFLSFDNKRLPYGIFTQVESGERFNLAKTDNEFYCQIE